MSDWWLVLLGTLAAYRLVRVVTLDKITEPIFDRLRLWLETRWIAKHAGDDEKLAYLYGNSDEWCSKLAFMLSCPWCLGFWVSGAVTMLLSVAYGLDYPVLVWLAMSTAVGFLGRIDSE